MPYTPSVNSSIALNTNSVEGVTFNDVIFCSKNMYFPDNERVRAYNSWDNIKDDTDIPADSTTYNVARLAFSQGQIETFYIGRREADSLTVTPSDVNTLVDYSFTVVVTDDATSTPVTTTPLITSEADATAATINNALYADADTGGDNAIANVTLYKEIGESAVVFTPNPIADAASYGFTMVVTAEDGSTSVTTTPAITSGTGATAGTITSQLLVDAGAGGTNEIEDVIVSKSGDDFTFTPDPVANSTVYSFTVVVTDSSGVEVITTPSITSDADATADEITAALVADATSGGTNEIANTTIVDNTGTFTLTPNDGYTIVLTAEANLVDDATTLTVTPDDGYTITLTASVQLDDDSTSFSLAANSGYYMQLTDLNRLSDSFTSSESAADLLEAIQNENDDWFFMTTDDHTNEFILDMAGEIEALSSSNYPKMYYVSTADANVVAATTDPVSDIISELASLNYYYTIADWNQNADTDFVEVAPPAYNGAYQSGAVNWKFMQLVGVSPVTDLVTGKALSRNKQGFIEDKNGNWFAPERGVDFYREGKVVNGEWIDVVRGLVWINNEIETEILNLLLNQQGSKIAFTTNGISQVTNTVDTVLIRARSLGILEGYIPCTAPAAADIPFADKVSRVLDLVEWTGYLAGAINTIYVNGNLTYSQSELS